MHVAIRVRGPVGPTIAAALGSDLAVQTETVLSGQVADDAAVHGLLVRLQSFGLGVVQVQVGGEAPTDAD